MNIRMTKLSDLNQLTILFESYRKFYKQQENTQMARQFLTQRLTLEDSVIIVAEKGKKLCGFTQLYPLFSSVKMQRIYMLNDLFVTVDNRQLKIASKLIDYATDYAKKNDANRLFLQTDIDNKPAQSLYEKKGWIRDQTTYYYELNLLN